MKALERFGRTMDACVAVAAVVVPVLMLLAVVAK